MRRSVFPLGLVTTTDPFLKVAASATAEVRTKVRTKVKTETKLRRSAQKRVLSFAVTIMRVPPGLCTSYVLAWLCNEIMKIEL
jgi:hypothetical protein